MVCIAFDFLMFGQIQSKELFHSMCMSIINHCKVDLEEVGEKYCFLVGCSRFTFNQAENKMKAVLDSIKFSKKLLETLEYPFNEDTVMKMRKTGFFEYFQLLPLSDAFRYKRSSIWDPFGEWDCIMFIIRSNFSHEALLSSHRTNIMARSGRRIPCKLRTFHKASFLEENSLMLESFVVFEELPLYMVKS